MTSLLAQRAITVTDFIGNVASVAAKAATTANEVSTFLLGVKLVASFIPGLSAVAGVLEIAQPIIQKIAIGAPILHRAIEQGDAVLAAAQRSGLVGSAKELYAVAVNADPERPETNVVAADVSEEAATTFVGSIFERSFFSPQDPRFENKNFG